MILQKLDQISALVDEIKAELATQPPTKPVVVVQTESELQAALLAGGDIQIEPGIYTGNFVASAPANITGMGAELRPQDVFTETLTISGSNVKVSGLTIMLGRDDRGAVLVTGDDNTIDACTVMATSTGGIRGITLYGHRNKVINSVVRGFWSLSRDAQAIWINGPGPYTIDNCFLEASGENILLGGSTFAQDVIPEDVLVTNNTLYKDPAWDSFRPLVKNSFEVKAGKRITFRNNTIDGCWAWGQAGSPIVITPRNQNGDNPWVIVDDVLIEDNVTINCPAGFFANVTGTDNIHPSLATKTLTIRNNISYDSPNGVQVGNPAGMHLVVEGNRFYGITKKFLSMAGPSTDLSLILTFINNITKQGEYGITGDGTMTGGLPALEHMTQAYLFINNIIEQHSARTISLPAGNTFVTSIAGM